MNCENCKFWEEYADDPSHDGDCHAHSPIVFKESCGIAKGYFPTINKNDWCGEFIAKITDFNCGDCAYWEQFSPSHPLTGEHGECRVDPPKIGSSEDESKYVYMRVFPVTGNYDWCSKFHVKE